jgi:hypothetical protein
MIIFLLPASVYAAAISIDTSPASVGVGDEFQATVFLTSDTAVNVFGGSLIYSDQLEIEKISDGNSLVSVWVERPHTDVPGSISFAGLIPGGFAGHNGRVFSILFKAKSSGDINFSLKNISLLRDDGAGTSERASVLSPGLFIKPAAQGGFVEKTDTTPPENFSVYLLEQEGKKASCVCCSG